MSPNYWLADAWRLPTVTLWLVTVPYAINAVDWFLFYGICPHDVAAMQGLCAATTLAQVLAEPYGTCSASPYVQARSRGDSYALPHSE